MEDRYADNNKRQRNTDVCRPEHAGMLDSGFRRLLHPGKKLLSPYVSEGDLCCWISAAVPVLLL